MPCCIIWSREIVCLVRERRYCFYEHEDLDSYVKGENNILPVRNKFYTIDDFNSGNIADIHTNPSGTKIIFRYSTTQNTDNGYISAILDTATNTVDILPITVNSWEDRLDLFLIDIFLIQIPTLTY